MPIFRNPLAGALVAVVWLASGDPPGARGAGPTRTFFTPDACAQCHSLGANRPPSAFGPPESPRLVRLDEYTTWDGLDKHRRAFEALTGPRGREIGVALDFADVSRERACLSCHGTGFLPDDPPAETSGAMDARSQGVGCTACHGPYLEWVQGHGIAGEPIRRWRRLSAAEKSRDHGLTNLRDPATRSKLCLSCHLGDRDEGKVITHAMYAAGHPPLPGFETFAFARAMPSHWWEPEEVPLFRQDPGLRARNLGERPESARTRDVLIGGAVALRESMRLIASEAEAATSTNWPEYARFECYSCHHDLKSPGYLAWRQTRRPGQVFDGLVLKGKAGHAQIRPWPLALVGPALTRAGTSIDIGAVRESLREGVKGLQGALDSRPFGDPAEVARAARKMESASQGLLETLNASRFDRSAPREMIAALASIPGREVPDYDSARQLAWAVRSIHDDWRPRPANDARIVGAIDELDRLLKLDTHTSREAKAKLIAAEGLTSGRLAAESIRLSEAEYRTSLAIAADYDPAAFKEVMTRISELTKETTLLPLPR